jgi:hypothetical protein
MICPFILVVLVLIIFFRIPVPYKEYKEGIDYEKIKEPDGTVLYKMNGGLTQKPLPFSFWERLKQGMDQIADGR